MKIAFIGHKGYPSLYGGVEKVVEEIANRMAERGHQCYVYSRSHYTQDTITRNNITNIIIKGIKSRRLDTLSHTFLSLLDVIKRDVDVVAIHSFGNAILNFIPKIFGIPVALHLHGFEWGQTRFNFIERKILLRLPIMTLKKYSDAITTVSIEQHKELNRRRIKNILIPNGVSRNNNHRILKKVDHDIYILYVGRIAYQKGIDTLIKAYIECSFYDMKLKIVGGHEHAEKYYNHLLELATGNKNIEFMGYKYGEELAEIYRNAFAIVIPSESEECPMVLLESLSFNKCIIASKIPGIYNIAEDNVIYFENKNHFDLADKLKRVYKNQIIRNEYEFRVSKLDMHKFDWDSIVDEYEKLYHHVILNYHPAVKKQNVKLDLDFVQYNIPNNKHHSLQILNDTVKAFDIKHKLYYKIIRPSLPSVYRKRFQQIYRSNVRKNTDLIDHIKRTVNYNLSNDQISKLYPDNKKCAVIITHDVDSLEGFKFIPKILELSKKFNIKSCWYIIPYKYPIDEGIIKLIKDYGDEIGIHGFNHDGKLFIDYKTFHNRSKFINAAVKKYNAKGFRSPMVHRNLLWLQELDIEYDASCFDYDPFQPFPGGTYTIWPFKFLKFIELPYTIPQDHTLFYELRQTDISIWKKKIDWIIKNNGMVLSITHPDYLMEKNYLSLFENLLDYVSSIEQSWKCLPCEMAEWWNKKERQSAQKIELTIRH